MTLNMLLMFIQKKAVTITLAFISTAASVLIFGWPWILFSRYFLRSKVRVNTPIHHQQKNNTPTMGGILILGTIIIYTSAWCNTDNPCVKVFLFCITTFSALGAWDDWYKIKYKVGISAYTKLIGQIICAVGTILLWFYCLGPVSTVLIPFTQIPIHIGTYPFFIWAVSVLIATSNAVNITDGLDGLAASCLIPNFLFLTFFSHSLIGILYLDSISIFDNIELANLSIICAGSLLGFLWYNKYPAHLFMGDVGSVGLGAALACIALMARCEIILVLTGIIFVLETVCVILQVLWYKAYHVRIFKMAPLHHHLELSGWSESEITQKFAIISCAISGSVAYIMWSFCM